MKFNLSWLVLLSLLSITFVLGSDTSKDKVVDIELKDSTEGVQLNEEQIKEIDQTKKKFQFETEVSRVMNIIIHSLYKNKEIFLRELISNGSDALDKLRLLSLTKKSKVTEAKDLYLTIKPDPATNTLIITDTGIGMTYNDLKKNLGTIAKSGTADFIKQFENNKDNNHLIGQFGVGFYSAFLVADKVQVISKNSEDEQYIWESSAISDFTIVKDPRGNTLGRGTQITLFLKEDAKEYLKPEFLEELIRKYSEYIEFPIYLWKKGKEIKKSDKDNVENEIKEETGEETGEEATEEDKLVEGFQLMNLEPPIWTKNPKNVTQEEHLRLFQRLNDNIGQPLQQIHFKAEGDSNFKAIIYVPELGFESLKLPKVIDTPIKLHVKRVFITDDTIKLIPDWLAFLRGIVDCDDIPLNVSRETVQNSRLVRVIKKKLLNKSFELFEQITKDETKYKKFLGDFGAHLKRGIREDEYHSEKIAKFLRFDSSHKKFTSLDEYIERMKPNQNKIYFITGGSMEALLRSPYVEKLVSLGYEVIYMDLPVDEFTMQYLRKYKGKELVHAIAAQNDVKDNKKELNQLEEEYKPLIDWFNEILKEEVESVKLSTRLIYSPTAITPSTLGGLSGNQERLMKAQAYASQQETEMNKWLNAKKGLELNPHHKIIQNLLAKINNNQMDKNMVDMAHLLFQTSMLRSDYDLPSPQAYADRVEILIRLQLGLDTQLDYPDVKNQNNEYQQNQEVKVDVDEEDSIEELEEHDEL
ncbi:heat shock protein Hsp90 [Neoconidiobolus thromboides FSU 785]|nr:heat shock protein Hsp90 [Neoconidiobolus thromboides FSU 785]